MGSLKLTREELAPLIDTARSGGSLIKRLNEVPKESYPAEFKKFAVLVDPLTELLTEQLSHLIPEVSRAGLLGHLTPKDGPTTFHDAWGKMVDEGWSNLASYNKKALINGLANSLVNYLISSPNPLPAEVAADNMILALETGTMPLMYGHESLLRSYNDGQILSVEFNGWNPKVLQVFPDGKIAEPKPGPEGKVFHQKVSFPSGRLLVADAIRVGPLDDYETAVRHGLGIDVNFSDHRVEYTGVLGSLGVISVMGTDSEPGLVVDPDTGNLFSAPSDDYFETTADVCSDYHGTSVIDRETLVQISLKYTPGAGTREEVEAKIDDWLASSKFANEVVVEPGEWHLYWDDDHRSVNEALDQSSTRCPEGIGFVISPKKLDLSHAEVHSFNGTQKLEEVCEPPSFGR